MAKEKRKKKKAGKKRSRELWVGLAAVATAMAALLALCLSMPSTSGPAETVPRFTSPQVRQPESNPYGPQDFSLENGYLTCTAGESVLGIDVSSHQKEVDWQQVADAGVKFAIVRLGYRGYESGAVAQDDNVWKNLRGAREAGLQVGAYFYSQAITVEEAVLTPELAKQQVDRKTNQPTVIQNENYDINRKGTVDINDAQLVYDMYNGKYDDFTTINMHRFLNADVNADKKITVTDAAAVVSAIK